MTDIGMFSAFLGGVLTLISPCSALLLPGFFAYAFQGLTGLLARTCVFFLGLCTVLIPIGIGAGTFGAFFAQHKTQLISIGGVVMIVLGLITFFGGGFTLPGLSSLAQKTQQRGTSWITTFLLGMVYGFSGFCAGPLLGAVLTTAVIGGNSLYGALVLVCYALGMCAPLFVLSWIWQRFDVGSLAWLRGKTITVGKMQLNSISMISGAMFIVVGCLFFFTHATATLPSIISTDTQFEIQQWVAEIGEKINNLTVVFGIALLAVIIFGIRVFKESKQSEK
ncbi:cytochrome c biogenesis CcdA family protein [Corynebacterium sp. sy039]|uniref:cytochrome c biogenesis CcdA family protein n=1 Tax=Corynebacterium sp. sy039 TaxID=2599641 RepID=UPI0011B359D3|nr:cytochrome c biogenesis CcdA family protein [Corynebacterium sp. sy039]QDZ43291.1 cytochrome c biogenesis protein CcdA [Corynebacterium sp. sy039]